jgi:glycerol-1-phosphate dehydrogenase [NAD(P)+]
MIGMRKLAEGKHADFHGKKVGVGTVTLCDLYHKATAITPTFRPDTPDWERVYAAYGENIKANIIRENSPPITDRLDPADIASKWDEIGRIVREELPTQSELLDIMKAAGAATTYAEIDTDESLARDVITYHPYMRDKIVLSRILRMTDIEPTEMVSVK